MKYTQTAFSFLIAIAVIAMAPQAVLALTVQDNTSGSSVTLPVVQDNTSGNTVTPPVVQNNGGADTVTPPVVQNNTGVNTITPPVVQNNTLSNTITPPAVQDNTSDTTVAPVTTPSTGGTNTPSTGSNGSGSGGSSNRNVLLPALTNIRQCDLITIFMGEGKDNPSTEVVKLQTFFNAYEGMNVPVTGIFDIATLAAVNAFQIKYTSDILAPWGVATPSGQVYITTTKKINEIFCKKSFTLTTAQVAEIEAQKASALNEATITAGNVGSTDSSETVSPTPTPSSNIGDTQVGAVAKTSIVSRIWNFVKRIFGR